MNFNFELILTLLTLFSGFITLLDICYLKKKRAQKSIKKPSILVEYSRGFFPVLFTILFLRSFLFDQFRIPSGSDKPTLLIGDFITINKFIYGVRWPVTHKKFISVREPKIGDMIVFIYPTDPSIHLIKRVIGTPGDEIRYTNKVLSINGHVASQKTLGNTVDKENDQIFPVVIKEENLLGVTHRIYVSPDAPAQDFTVVVPPESYFVMGDNRDDSKDSRYWGFVPEQNLSGKASAIWFSWNKEVNRVRWPRIGMLIH